VTAPVPTTLTVADPRPVAVSPIRLDPEEEDRRLIKIRHKIEILIKENKYVRFIHPSELNITKLRELEIYYNEDMIRRVKVTRFQRRSRRWFIFGCLVIELWLSKILGIDVTGFMEDQLDDKEEMDMILYELGEEYTPYHQVERSSPTYRLLWNSVISLVIVGGLNWIVQWLRSKSINGDLIKSGKDVLKRLVRDEDELFNTDDPGLQGLLNFVTPLKNFDLSSITSDPRLAPLAAMAASTFPGLFSGAAPPPQPTSTPWSTASSSTSTTPSSSTRTRYNL
jgi:hypothetical protein